ncbi:hypothetical protein HK102_005294 [Quaeritorhiza haematococci]|nr:hypothetical protein HK102_005294 [Quaeritorhiza haematococci]
MYAATPASRFLALAAAAGLAVSINGVAAQCPGFLVDDFTTVRPPGAGPLDMLNLVGGKYGDSGSNVDFQVADGRVEVTVTGAGDNFWFFTSDPTPDNPCLDISPYSALSFDLQLPAGADFQLTFTQKLTDCTTRGNDSSYVPITQLGAVADGTMRTITVPFKQTFAKNTAGGDYDFTHHKDVTFVNIKPVGAKLYVDNIRWTCAGVDPSSVTGGSSSSAGGNNGTAATATRTGVATATATAAVSLSTPAAAATSATASASVAVTSTAAAATPTRTSAADRNVVASSVYGLASLVGLLFAL